MTDYRGVWVFAEQREGELRQVSLELLGLGRRLADELGVALEAVLLGQGVEALSRELIAAGAELVLLAEHPLLQNYQTECYAKVLSNLIAERRPEILLVGSTTLGRDLAPRLSTRLGTGLMADCIDFSIDQERRMLVGVKPVMGGNALANIACPERRPQVVTVRPRVLPPVAKDPTRQGEVVRVEANLEPGDARTRILRTVREGTGQADLEEAEVIVAAGQGVGCPENLSLLEGLANQLGAALGATRPVVEAGWLPEASQIGQSGKTVRPRLYIACGIHGATFHTVGMQNSDIIVAINDDPQAPIFKIATIGIVGDLREVIPAISKKLRESLAPS
jgi:electron transfer flavoprotein alpha subunit